jgi:hypothetical protein
MESLGREEKHLGNIVIAQNRRRRHNSCFDLPRHTSMSDLFFSDELAA